MTDFKDKTINTMFGPIRPKVVIQSFLEMQRQLEQAAEFERLAMCIQYHFHLDHAYTLDEIKQACSQLASCYADTTLRTMTILNGDLDIGVARHFFSILAEATKGAH